MIAINKISLLATAVLLLAAATCQEDKMEAIKGKKWILESIRGKAVTQPDAEQPAYLIFRDSNRVHGFSGCNSFFAIYRLTEEGISIQPQGMTMSTCPPGYSDRPLRAAFLLTDRLELEAGKLHFLKGAEALATFSEAPDEESKN